VLLRLVMSKNEQVLEAMKRRDDIVTYEELDNALMEILKDKVEEKVNARVQQTTVRRIRDVMTNLKLSVEQAMDVLDIPQSQRMTYAELVGKSEC